MKNESDPFYLGVIHRPRSNIRFKTSKLGERSLPSVMKNMADAVELLGKKVSNHSARRICITTLRQENIDNLSIAGLSGHRNLFSLDDYSTINEEQQREMTYMISKRLGQSGQQLGVRSTLGHSRIESICQPLQKSPGLDLIQIYQMRCQHTVHRFHHLQLQMTTFQLVYLLRQPFRTALLLLDHHVA